MAKSPSKEPKPSGEIPRAAIRALNEARLRREKSIAKLPREIRGRKGPDPVRYGDWEKNGIVSDF